jgi:hypothetical protein
LMASHAVRRTPRNASSSAGSGAITAYRAVLRNGCSRYRARRPPCLALRQRPLLRTPGGFFWYVGTHPVEKAEDIDAGYKPDTHTGTARTLGAAQRAVKRPAEELVREAHKDVKNYGRSLRISVSADLPLRITSPRRRSSSRNDSQRRVDKPQ